MKFLVKAHLPPGICRSLERHGHDAVHAAERPARNETRDRVLNQVSMDEERVVVSEDSDFFYSHLLQGRPWKLLLVHISTRDLTELFDRHLAGITAALRSHTLVELDRLAVTPVRP